MKLTTDLERLLPCTLTLYGWYGCLVLLDHLSRTTRNDALWIILVTGLATFVVNRRKWMTSISNNKALDAAWSITFGLLGPTTLQCLDEWFHFPSYMKFVVVGISVIAIVFIVILAKRRKRIVAA